MIQDPWTPYQRCYWTARCKVILPQKRRNKWVNFREKFLWAIRPFLFERKIPCFPFCLACRSGYTFGVQYVQCISNYCHSWLASKSAVLKNMKCKLGSLFYLGFCYCFLSLLLWKSICSLSKKTPKDLILTKWMYFSFIQSKCSSFPSDISSRQ